MHEAIHFSFHTEADVDQKECESLNLPQIFFTPNPLDPSENDSPICNKTLWTKQTRLSYANLLIEIPNHPDIPLDPIGSWKTKAILIKGLIFQKCILPCAIT